MPPGAGSGNICTEGYCCLRSLRAQLAVSESALALAPAYLPPSRGREHLSFWMADYLNPVSAWRLQMRRNGASSWPRAWGANGRLAAQHGQCCEALYRPLRSTCLPPVSLGGSRSTRARPAVRHCVLLPR